MWFFFWVSFCLGAEFSDLLMDCLVSIKIRRGLCFDYEMLIGF